MTEATVIQGRESYLALCSEDLWNVNPFRSSGSGDSGTQGWVMLPPDAYTVKFVPQSREADPYIGIIDEKHSRFFRGMTQGQLTSKLYGYHENGQSLAEYVMQWGFGDHGTIRPRSKTALWFEGPGTADKEHSGLRCNSATLSGSSDGGALDLSLDLMGSGELGNSALVSHPAVPDNRNKLQDFEFHRCSLTIGGVAYEMENFSWAVQRNLIPKWGTNFTPYLLTGGKRIETLTFQLIKSNDTFDGYRRSESRTRLAETVLTLIGAHEGTAANTYTRCTITFPALEYVGHEDVMGNGTITEQPLQFKVMKPDTSANRSTMVWDTTS